VHPESARRVTFLDVLRVRQYRWLWFADAQSNLGDQLARVALTILVFRQTGSALLTAATYSLTFLPALIGGVLLSGFADRYSRRTMMVSCDLARAVLLGLMTVPGLPIAVLSALLVLAVLIGSPFSAAQAAVIPDILDKDRYVVAVALRSVTGQLAQLAGFAGGGILVAAIGSRPALMIDAVTFAISALVLRVSLDRHLVRSTDQESSTESYLSGLTAGFRLIITDVRLRGWLGLALLVGLYVIPEGIAAPFAQSIGGGSSEIGILMAAAPTGTAVGSFLVVRVLSAPLRAKLLGPMAVAAGLPLAAFAIKPGLAVAVGLLFLSGVFTAYLVQAMSSFTQAVPTEQRGQVIGLASSAFLVAQGLGLVLAGVFTSPLGPATTIAAGGGLGALLALGCALSLRRAPALPGEQSPSRPAPRHAAARRS
jgi:MFS family permease